VKIQKLGTSAASYREQVITVLLARIKELEAELDAVPLPSTHEFERVLNRLHEARYVFAILPKLKEAQPRVPL
jgi:hypothetical protein